MQKEILEKNPSATLSLYVVWFSMLPSDSRSRWAWTGGVLADPRASHFWDEQKLIGRSFAQWDPQKSDSGIVWDTYYLYGPNAHWEDRPQPLISSGSTVRSEADELKSKLLTLLR